ncbi:MAG: amino acid permease [Sediminibacterium sp.]|nr:amino acid permease [Sediminibacterium sp.]TXT34337.1 MAG: basic amino acid/polyamine antiporter APA family [Chitinophagaceae bacterium]
MMRNKRHFSVFTAMALVIANMIGSGVYTSLGFQLMDFESSFSILMLWVVGGLIALSGALVYAELATALPNNGGEMNFLSKLYGPIYGFLAGWISTLAGFAAPVAIVCIAIGNYATGFLPNIEPILISTTVLVLLTILHAWKSTISARFQQYATLMNISIIGFIVIASFLLSTQPIPSIIPTNNALHEITGSGKFAVNLYWVLYAYTGWNAATYIAGEIKDPARNLPIALLGGTLLVTLLYLLLNYAFLLAAPANELKGQINVGFIAANHLFGAKGAMIMSICICITLISSASAMTFSGPRVTAVMGEEIHNLRILKKLNNHGIPYLAVYTQSALALLLIWLNQFQFIIDLIGFLLSASTSLAVAGVFIVRKRLPFNKHHYRTPFYPFVPIFFLAINAWIIYYGISLKPLVSLYGTLVILIGIVFFKLSKRGSIEPIQNVN